MAYECENCGNKDAHILQFSWTKTGMEKSCNGCGARAHGTPDVYFKGAYMDTNLSNWENPGPKLITSRAGQKILVEQMQLKGGWGPGSWSDQLRQNFTQTRS